MKKRKRADRIFSLHFLSHFIPIIDPLECEGKVEKIADLGFWIFVSSCVCMTGFNIRGIPNGISQTFLRKKKI